MTIMAMTMRSITITIIIMITMKSNGRGLFYESNTSTTKPRITMRRLVLCLGLFCSASQLWGSDQIPGKPQKRPIAVTHATVHTVVGETLNDATVLFDDGKIVEVGPEVTLPEGTEVIDGHGKHVYPSLIDAYSDIGLVEIDSVRATIDNAEMGSINSNVRAVVAFNPDSELIPVNRANGILLAVSAPQGGLVSGRGSLMMLDGWTWEDMTLAADTGMFVNWPSSDRGIEELATLVEQTRLYREARQGGEQPLDLRLEAMLPVLDKTMPMVATARSVQQIENAVAFARKHQLRLIIHGGYEAPACAELLKQEQVPVIISAVYRLPSRRHAPYDEAYTLPARLEAVGVKYCISAGGRFGASGLRNLPYNAATAAAYGLTEEQALRSITLSAAEILSVADRVGSIQPGMDATLFIADGDILETPTQVEAAFIQGRKVDLDNKHEQLYRKYSAKYSEDSEN
jgi:imidazolonepropionase-like amidohydrolase